MIPSPLDGVGLNPNIHSHYTDHLAVVCIIMGCPLLFTDQEAVVKAKRNYPGLKTKCVDWEDVNPDTLCREYDVFFQCDLWPREQLYTLLDPLEKKYQKRVRNVHCPHGFSDKVFWLQRVVEEDITLIYGPNMIDMLEAEGTFGLLNSYVITGNYRYHYFKKNQEFYETMIQKQILSRFPEKKPLLLYAPTWNDSENSSSFPIGAKALLQHLPKEYNLLIKLHPRIEENFPIEVDQVLHPYRNHPNIAFVDDFSLIYPLLSQVDLYIGDHSSIGYDFLAFNKPMLFFNPNNLSPKTDRQAYLFQCGYTIPPNDYPNVYSFVEKSLVHGQEELIPVRDHVYRYTFGEEKSFSDIRKEIWEACEAPRPKMRSSLPERPLWRDPLS